MTWFLRFAAAAGYFGILAGPSMAGDLLVSSESTHSVKRYSATTGAYVGDFVAPGSGGLGGPQGIAFGPDGNLYVSSRDSNQVVRYSGTTGAFMNVFTSGTAMVFPADITFRGGFLYVSQFRTAGRVSRFNAVTGAFVDDFTQGGTFPGADGQAWDASGNLYVSNFGGNTIRKYSSTGAFLGNFATTGGMSGPLDLRFGTGGDLFVNSFNTGSVKRYDGASGAYEGDFITGLGGTQGQEIGPDGMLYVGSYTQSRIARYDPTTGAFLGDFVAPNSGGLAQPNNFTFMPDVVPEPMTLIALALPLAMIRRRN